MKHTPEPWSTDSRVIYDSSTRLIVFADGCPAISVAEDFDNAARIVACVNACAGIPTEALVCQTKKELTANMIAELADLRRQRDELFNNLVEAKALLSLLECDNALPQMRRINALIAKIKGAA